MILRLAASCIPTFLFMLSYWIHREFGSPSVEAILFTINTPLSGAPIAYYIRIGIVVIKTVIVSFLVYFLLFILIKRRTLRLFLILFLFISSFAYVEINFHVIDYITTRNQYSSFIDDKYVYINAKDIQGSNKNVVIILMESMENSVADEALFGENLIPRLTAIRDANIGFYTHHASEGTTWTVGGMTAYFMGIPLKLPIDINSYDNTYADFLPSASCILSLFSAQNYSVALIMGAPAQFGGIQNFFHTHAPQARIFDYTYFSSARPEMLHPGGWGVTDSKLYAYAKEYITGLADGNAPFFVTIATIDTHVPGHGYGDFPEPYHDDRDAFIAADYMIHDFLTWMSGQPFYKDTVVIVLGDHCYMSKTIGAIKIPDEYDRTVYNAFINTGLPLSPAYSRRQFASFDIAPTILESAGIELPDGKFGLGVSLFRDTPTLVEQYGLEYVNEQTRRCSVLYDSFFVPGGAPRGAVQTP